MSNTFDLDPISKFIESHFRTEIEKIVNSIIEEAKLTAIEEIRKKTGSIAANIFNSFDYMQDQHRLCITVNFKDLNNDKVSI